jgi:hypothetical protein
MALPAVASAAAPIVVDPQPEATGCKLGLHDSSMQEASELLTNPAI